MAYEPQLPAPTEGDALARWLTDELRHIAAELLDPNPLEIRLQPWNAAPARLFNGQTVLADGTNWDPGSGEGVYTYYNSTWNKLG